LEAALLAGLQVGSHAVAGRLLMLKPACLQACLMLKPAPANVSCAIHHRRHQLGANQPSATTTLFLRPRPMAIWARPNTTPAPPALRIKVCRVLPKAAAFVETFTELSVTFVEITFTETGACLAPASGQDSPCRPFLAPKVSAIEI
jgi:hypothetical protein